MSMSSEVSSQLIMFCFQPNWPPYGLIRWLGVYFGLVWMVVPALLLVRNVRLASSAASKKEDSKRKKR